MTLNIDETLFNPPESNLEITPTPETATSTAEIAVQPRVWNEILVRLVMEKLQWYPTSDYIAIMDVYQIKLMQYDGTNEEIVYAGPLQDHFYTISPDWNLLVLINLNPKVNDSGDLYSVGIK